MIFKIKVYTRAKEDFIVKDTIGYIVYVKERAEKGKANLKVTKLLARELGVSSNAIKIKNPTSRVKIIEVKDEIRRRA